MKKDNRERCSWATTELYKEYHDREWGEPVHDDRKLFEMGEMRNETLFCCVSI